MWVSFIGNPDNDSRVDHLRKQQAVFRRGAMSMVPYRYLEDIVAAFVGDTGTMTCAYGVPFHITQGPPFFGSVG